MDIANAPSAAVGKSLCEVMSGRCCCCDLVFPHTGFPLPALECMPSRDPPPRAGVGRGWGWITEGCWGPRLEADGSPEPGIVGAAAPFTEAAVLAGGVAEDGRDHPGPAADRVCGAAVSFVVTSRECEVVVCVCGRAERCDLVGTGVI